MSHKSVDRLLEKIVLSLCERIDSPRSLAVWLCFKEDQKSLLELNAVRSSDYSNPHDFEVDYMVTNLLSKYKGLETGIDTRAVALSGWRAAEIECAKTNRFIRTLGCNLECSKEHLELNKILFLAQRKIATVLGEFKLQKLLDGGRWGPGATLDLRRNSGLDHKISNVLTVTQPALRYLKAVIEADPHWTEALIGLKPEGPFSLTKQNFKVVQGSRFLTVPKSAKTDRCIAAEPTGNGFLQQGVGRFLRRRLARFGVDLDDQSINQNLAARAVSLGLATLDLKAASDTISRELVHTLLPVDWAFFLDDIRSKWSRVDGEWVALEKFSSMGNAFTFELESLIFWALSVSVTEVSKVDGAVSVYGDDLIVPSACAEKLIDVLELCGFKTNVEKSFITGLFRESCGAHFFDGHLVTPLYQKEIVTPLHERIRLANRLVRWSERVFWSWRSTLVKAAVNAIHDFTRKELNGRPFPAIPLGSTGDDGFLVPRSWLLPLDVHRGINCHVYVWKEGQRWARDNAMLANKLRNPRFTASRKDGKQTIAQGDGRWVHRVRWIQQWESPC